MTRRLAAPTYAKALAIQAPLQGGVAAGFDGGDVRLFVAEHVVGEDHASGGAIATDPIARVRYQATGDGPIHVPAAAMLDPSAALATAELSAPKRHRPW
jgi:hypothetical protein